MKQGNPFHVFNTLLILALGIIIGAMALYILTTAPRAPMPAPVPTSESSEQRKDREKLDSPRPVNKKINAPELGIRLGGGR